MFFVNPNAAFKGKSVEQISQAIACYRNGDASAAITHYRNALADESISIANKRLAHEKLAAAYLSLEKTDLNLRLAASHYEQAVWNCNHELTQQIEYYKHLIRIYRQLISLSDDPKPDINKSQIMASYKSEEEKYINYVTTLSRDGPKQAKTSSAPVTPMRIMPASETSRKLPSSYRMLGSLRSHPGASPLHVPLTRYSASEVFGTSSEAAQTTEAMASVGDKRPRDNSIASLLVSKPPRRLPLTRDTASEVSGTSSEAAQTTEAMASVGYKRPRDNSIASLLAPKPPRR